MYNLRSKTESNGKSCLQTDPVYVKYINTIILIGLICFTIGINSTAIISDISMINMRYRFFINLIPSYFIGIVNLDALSNRKDEK